MNAIEQLTNDFELLTDWEDRYRHIIELGRALPVLSEEEHCDKNKVNGCMSQVWMVSDVDSDGRYAIRADSDAHIVKGLIAILLMAYSGKTPAEISAVDIDAIFKRLGLDQHLSPNRRNGFFAMVGRIRALTGS